ncbi:asparagine synthetase B [Salipaludibacillus neizhouensis]|uniref:asparagine synthase (glutamine-hydrolyzing) n=1 Tax=Salipaludibacillus neizhouensis TaxID=885475 RepID=A0A3A9K9R7_9BACI|nr:lasso peptide isopeptide bond-forming cyclase [Salipaludibacillus neizhouensis]RKL66393.1 asparagine synthetase B [Salipaludibacillus neizhouensis]
MSAIAGILHTNDEPVSQDNIDAIMESLLQFPANDIQIWKKQNIFLGCHAQWITPESVGELLPFYDYERQLAITADAIIDNRSELFNLLQVDREDRKKMTDSQLMLLAYDKWGEESPKYLIGDFAFVLWDEKKQKLFGARDHAGYRTLYYHFNQNKFSFCTTIEPLLSLPYIPKNLNEEWLAEYLAISGNIDTVDAITTPYEKIYQIPPAHSFSIYLDQLKLTRYCSLYPDKKIKLNSNEEYVEAFQEVFQKAVKARLRTHHNVGSQLSGGLDSGAVVGFAAKEMRKENKQLHTFSYIPPRDFIDFTPNHLLADERPFIKSTVHQVGGISDHYLDFEGENSYSEIDTFLEINEMPYKFFENSFWLKGMFEVAEEKGVGILLNGDRGNYTISWGSAFNYFSILMKKLKWVKLYQELNKYSRKIGGSRLRNLPHIACIGYPVLNRFSNNIPWKLPRIINHKFSERTDVFNKLKKSGLGETGWFTTNDIYKERKRLFEDFFPWNTGNSFTCKLSLRHSLWKRDPTNDLRVIRFCLSIPDDQYVQQGLDRALIRRATKDILPDKVRLNQRIHGVQGADWVHRMKPYWGSFVSEVDALTKDDRMLAFLDRDILNTALEKVKKGPRVEYATDTDYKILMRSIIISRFVKNFN